MTLTEAVVWFVCTALGVVALLVLGMYESTHAYDRRHHHWHLHH